MKQLWIFSFYFEPDLSAGSFRNTSLVNKLLEMTDESIAINVVTTLPNRYKDFSASADGFEDRGRLKIHRIKIPKHANGMGDQIRSFMVFFKESITLIKSQRVDLVYASSSRLFTGFLGAVVSKWKKAPLYLDIRDIFSDTIHDVLAKKPLIRPLHALVQQIERWTIRRASHLNLISGGFRSYFSYYQGPVSEYTNGIDDLFLNGNDTSLDSVRDYKMILYAGNIGEGQGLEKIIPELAKRLGTGYRFRIIGSGGTRSKLENELKKHGLSNVEIEEPMQRKQLLEAYKDADYFFIHLNDYPAFRKVLPSKIFELAAMDKPLIAGVSGYAAEFLRTHVSNIILFDPGDVDHCASLLQSQPYLQERRNHFIESFQRSHINSKMAQSILRYI